MESKKRNESENAPGRFLIGISGKIGCGKSELAKEILARSGCIKVSFGDAIKEEVAEHFGIPLEFCYSESGKNVHILHPEFPNGGMTVRQVLQWWGTDVRRAEDPGYWVKRTRERIEEAIQVRSCSVVVDDVRFEDEAGLIRSLGGMLVRLEPYPGWQPGQWAGHKSETALDGWKDWDLVTAPEYGAIGVVAEKLIKKELKNLGIQELRTRMICGTWRSAGRIRI